MDARLNVIDNPVGAKFWKYIVLGGQGGLGLDAARRDAGTREDPRQSDQCCAGCLDMHTKDATHAGETSTRLNLIGGLARGQGFHRRRARCPGADRARHRIADAAGVSRTMPGRMQPSTMTRTSSPPWCL